MTKQQNHRRTWRRLKKNSYLYSYEIGSDIFWKSRGAMVYHKDGAWHWSLSLTEDNPDEKIMGQERLLGKAKTAAVAALREAEGKD